MNASLFAIVFACLVACITAQIGGSIDANPTGGHTANIAAVHRIGDQNANLGAGVFASGNPQKGPVTTGAFIDANKNGHGVSLQHTNTPGFGETFSQNARVNLLNDNMHKVDANAFHGRTNMENGFNFDRVGGGLNYNHAAGHAASLSASRIPQLNMNSMDLTGKANLWTSQNRATTFDLMGSASRTFGGSMPSRNNFGVGLGMSHRF